MERSGLRHACLVAFSLAILAGAVESLRHAYRHYVDHGIAFVSYDYWWMPAAAFVVLVVPAALLVYGASAAVRRPFAPATLAGLVSFILIFSLLLPYGALAWWASAILAAGAGRQIAGLLARDPSAQRVKKLARVAIWTGSVFACAGIAVRVDLASAERGALAEPAGDSGKPNVLVVVLDTVRSANLSFQGYARKTTPALERLAAEGAVFDQAFATAPWTLPSHASLFTGLPANETRTSWQAPLPAELPTLGAALQSAGYLSAGFASNLIYASWETGLSRGFGRYSDYRFSLELMLLHAPLYRVDIKSRVGEARGGGETLRAIADSHVQLSSFEPADVFTPAEDVAAAFLDWQATVGRRPFFAFINFFDAHGPYEGPARGGPYRVSEDVVSRFATRDGGTLVDRYDAAIAWLDEVVGRTLQTLRDRGALDNTIVVITSDHGEHFGEHGLSGHANSLYLELLHVPLVVRYPSSVPAGTRVSSLVSLRDVPATVLDLAGITGHRLSGRSLRACWHGCPPVVGDVVAHLDKGINVPPEHRNASGPLASRLDERFQYIRGSDGSEELYDHRVDRLQQHNLAADPARGADLTRLRRLLERR